MKNQRTLKNRLKRQNKKRRMKRKRGASQNQRQFMNKAQERKQENLAPQTKKNTVSKPNDLCSCGSGKKYKKCCIRYHQAEMLIIVPISVVSEITYNVNIKTKDGEFIEGYSMIRLMSLHEFYFDIETDKEELLECLKNWESYSTSRIDNYIIPSLHKHITDGEINTLDTGTPNHLTDTNNKTIENYDWIEYNSVKKIENVSVNKPIEIELKTLDGNVQPLSPELNLELKNPEQYLDDLLKEAYKFFKEEIFSSVGFCISPLDQIKIALEYSAYNYSILKYGKVFTKTESDAFIDDTLTEIKKAGKYETLIEKTKEMQEAFRAKYEEITSHQLDDFVNDWLELLILPKHYSKEEDKLRFEAVRNWYWSFYLMETGIYDAVDLDKEINHQKDTESDPGITYTSFKKEHPIIGMHLQFSEIEKRLLSEMARNPEFVSTYFYQMINGTEELFKIVPKNWIDDFLWASSNGFTASQLSTPIIFRFGPSRSMFYQTFGKSTLQNLFKKEGFWGFSKQFNIKLNPKGIFSNFLNPNPVFKDNIKAYYESIGTNMDRFEAMWKLENKYLAYQYFSQMLLSESAVKLFLGNDATQKEEVVQNLNNIKVFRKVFINTEKVYH
ncbi:MAG: hypothetical protein D8M58_21765 [Calditrichaeota bacterium]|nr:MAG: hypothetical protein DWQ03_00710 [Calditrichota bacterium]MBL1208043.1 hypothetical protein [Calditrichota bacterium]NOG47878.1 hypothetical protein [Calditrichota bacterium]